MALGGRSKVRGSASAANRRNRRAANLAFTPHIQTMSTLLSPPDCARAGSGAGFPCFNCLAGKITLATALHSTAQQQLAGSRGRCSLSRPTWRPVLSAAPPAPAAAAAAWPPAAAPRPCLCTRGQIATVEQELSQAGIQASKTVWPSQTGQGRRIAASTDGARLQRGSHTNQPTPGATTRKSYTSRKQKQAHLSRMLSAPPIRRRATAADVLGRGLGGSSSAAWGLRRKAAASQKLTGGLHLRRPGRQQLYRQVGARE